MKKSLYLLAVLAAVVSMLFSTVTLFATETDDRIESSAKMTHVFKTYLKVKNEMTVADATGEKSDEKTMAQKTDTVIEAIDDASITALVKTSLLYRWR